MVLDDTVLVTVTNSEKFSAFHLEQEVGEKVEALSEVINLQKRRIIYEHELKKFKLT